jgi:hypothetical protein
MIGLYLGCRSRYLKYEDMVSLWRKREGNVEGGEGEDLLHISSCI